jgi:hypothetical protein
LISDKPMTEEEWAKERATVIDDQTNNNEPARFGDGREEKHMPLSSIYTLFVHM